MSEMQLSPWARARFGDAAADLARLVPAGIQRAHELAVDAHVASELPSNDVYGRAVWVNQHLQLIEYTRDIPGVTARKPAGVRSRFDLVIVEETNVALYVWRYATDHKTTRPDARMKLSDLRRNLLTLTDHVHDPSGDQLSFDDLDVDHEAAAAERAEEQAVLRELARAGRVVTIGYASNTAGLIHLGWGDCELLDDQGDQGYVAWPYWEQLPLADGGEQGGVWMPRRPGDGPPPGRFDADAPLDDDFGLTARSPLDPPQTSEPEPEKPETGSDDSR